VVYENEKTTGENILKTALITGSSSGFGKQLVHDFLKEGYRVIATLRNANERESLFKEIPQKNLFIKELDVTKKSDITALSDFIKSELNGNLDILVNNAGYGMYGALEDISEEQIRYQIEVNFFGPSFLIRTLLPYLRESKGKIFNISSLMGRFSMPLGAVYSASKYALEGLSEGLYYELGPMGVQVTTIQPGAHRTGFGKAVQWGDSSLSEESSYQTQTQALQGMIDKMMSRKNSPGANNVSRIVLKYASKRKLPRRILVGKDARSTGWMQKILPERLYHFILDTSYRLFLKKGES
jgi:short-subunit dehydrogenase